MAGPSAPWCTGRFSFFYRFIYVSHYTKPFLQIPEQLALLQQRGMIIDHPEYAAESLRRIGYYRLSAYWYPFRVATTALDESGKLRTTILDHYKPDTSFTTVLSLYVFDKKLRLLVLDALERIEIALRTDIALLLGERDPWAHREPTHLHGHFARKIQPRSGRTRHAEWLDRLDDIERRSREDFVLHFRKRYPRSTLPIWIAVELWDFGMLSHFLGGMKIQDHERLAERYGLADRELLPNWVRTLNFVRNVSAHHGRLWNRALVDFPKMPQLGAVPLLDHLVEDHFAHGRLYAAAALMRYLLRIINPGTSWPDRLADLVATFPSTPPVPFSGSGFPDGWADQPLWAEAPSRGGHEPFHSSAFRQ